MGHPQRPGGWHAETSIMSGGGGEGRAAQAGFGGDEGWYDSPQGGSGSATQTSTPRSATSHMRMRLVQLAAAHRDPTSPSRDPSSSSSRDVLTPPRRSGRGIGGSGHVGAWDGNKDLHGNVARREMERERDRPVARPQLCRGEQLIGRTLAASVGRDGGGAGAGGEGLSRVRQLSRSPVEVFHSPSPPPEGSLGYGDVESNIYLRPTAKPVRHNHGGGAREQLAPAKGGAGKVSSGSRAAAKPLRATAAKQHKDRQSPFAWAGNGLEIDDSDLWAATQSDFAFPKNKRSPRRSPRRSPLLRSPATSPRTRPTTSPRSRGGASDGDSYGDRDKQAERTRSPKLSPSPVQVFSGGGMGRGLRGEMRRADYWERGGEDSDIAPGEERDRKADRCDASRAQELGPYTILRSASARAPGRGGGGGGNMRDGTDASSLREHGHGTKARAASAKVRTARAKPSQRGAGLFVPVGDVGMYDVEGAREYSGREREDSGREQALDYDRLYMRANNKSPVTVAAVEGKTGAGGGAAPSGGADSLPGGKKNPYLQAAAVYRVGALRSGSAKN